MIGVEEDQCGLHARAGLIEKWLMKRCRGDASRHPCEEDMRVLARQESQAKALMANVLLAIGIERARHDPRHHCVFDLSLFPLPPLYGTLLHRRQTLR